MPFITEELWARMAEHAVPRRSMLILSPWPELDSLPVHEDARAEMSWVIELISGIRSVRSEMRVPPAARIALVLKDADQNTAERLNSHRDIVLTMARLSNARISTEIPSGSAQFVVGEAIAALPLGDVIDLNQERVRLQKDLKKAEDEMARFDAKLKNPAFVARAPEEVIEEQKEKRAEAHHLEPVVRIGAEGLTAAVIKETDAALNAHGLIKVRVFSDERETRDRREPHAREEHGGADAEQESADPHAMKRSVRVPFARDVHELQLLALDDRVLQRVEVLGRRARRGRAAPLVRIDDDGRRRSLRVGAERLG